MGRKRTAIPVTVTPWTASKKKKSTTVSKPRLAPKRISDPNVASNVTMTYVQGGLKQAVAIDTASQSSWACNNFLFNAPYGHAEKMTLYTKYYVKSTKAKVAVDSSTTAPGTIFVWIDNRSTGSTDFDNCMGRCIAHNGSWQRRGSYSGAPTTNTFTVSANAAELLRKGMSESMTNGDLTNAPVLQYYLHVELYNEGYAYVADRTGLNVVAQMDHDVVYFDPLDTLA